jgi:hypothetical protein
VFPVLLISVFFIRSFSFCLASSVPVIDDHGNDAVQARLQSVNSTFSLFFQLKGSVIELLPIRLSCNPYFLACFFSRNSIFLSQQISEQYFQPSERALSKLLAISLEERLLDSYHQCL